MKNLLLIPLIALFASSAVRADDSKTSRSDLVARVESCEAILQEFTTDSANGIPPAVLQSAKAVIVLNQFKAGFIFGVKAGYGVIMVKHSNGHWSVPVLLNAGEASLGFQLGAKSVESVLIITDEHTPRLLFNSRFNVGVDAKAVAGPKAAEVERFNKPTLNGPVLVYAHSKGLFAGATVKVGTLARNDEANFTLYNSSSTLPELLYGDWTTPPDEVRPIMNLVSRLSP